MSNFSPEEIAVIGTAIAMELAKGKSKDEIKIIKALVLQIHSTLLTLLN